MLLVWGPTSNLSIFALAKGKIKQIAATLLYSSLMTSLLKCKIH